MKRTKLFSFVWIIVFVFTIISNQSQCRLKIFDDGLFFDGQKDIAIFTSDNFVDDNTFTIEILVKINAFNSYKSGNNHTRQFIIFKRNSLDFFNECFTIYIDEAQKSLLATIASSEGKQIHLSTQKDFIELGKWYSIVLSSDSKSIRFYVNNNLQSKKELPFSFDWGKEPMFVGGRMLLGINNQPYDGRLNGIIKYIYIYDSPTEEDIITNNKINNTNHNLISSIESIDDIIYLNDTKIINEMNCFAEISPNPVNDRTELRISLDDEMPISIQIFSPTGINYCEVYSGNLQKGSYRFNISHLFNRATSGLYFCKITAKKTYMIPFVVIQ